MKNITKYAIAAVACIALSGCITRPTAGELANADYGTLMTETDCQNLVKSTMRSYLKDPESAQYEFGSCRQAWSGSLMGKPPVFGYRIDVSINGRNSFGGYTGYTQYQFYMRNGSVLKKLKSLGAEYGNAMFPF